MLSNSTIKTRIESAANVVIETTAWKCCDTWEALAEAYPADATPRMFGSRKVWTGIPRVASHQSWCCDTQKDARRAALLRVADILGVDTGWDQAEHAANQQRSFEIRCGV